MLQSLLKEGVFALDVRPGDDFAAGHVPGSVSIPLSGDFAFWAGSLLGLSSRPVLIAASEEQLSEVRTRLARVALTMRGVLRRRNQGMDPGRASVGRTGTNQPRLLSERLQKDKTQLLDVRRKPEWERDTSRERPGLRWTISKPRTSRSRCQRLIARHRWPLSAKVVTAA